MNVGRAEVMDRKDSSQLSADQRRYLELISPGADSVADAVASLRIEMMAIAGPEMSSRIDAGLDPRFRRSSESTLTQEAVSALFSDPGYFANNALNNIQKVAQDDKVALRLRALDEVAAFSGGSVLDFGCGAGAQVLALRALGCRTLWAAEVDDGLLDFVRRRYAHRFGEDLPLWNILTAPGPNTCFDAVLVLDVFPVIEDPAATIAAIVPTLRAGAHLFYNPAPISQKQRETWAYLVGRDPDQIEQAFSRSGFSRVWNARFGTHDLVCQRFDG
jgi:SAM-dependent methyltransferase